MLVGTLLVVTTWCVLAQGEAIKSQPARGDGTQAPAESSGAIAEFKADAKDYSIRLDARPKEKLVLCDEPLFRWGNPARTGEDGVIFVWLLNGRPEVIGSVFTYRIGNLIRRKHEYHSLAAGPLAAEYRGQRVWAPRT
ncbi:MAG TPA: hypothetical protein VGY66_26095, partial [Gemmataceae bacterium]|nr:hypothetical protein [Gemmataceae bacterium]